MRTNTTTRQICSFHLFSHWFTTRTNRLINRRTEQQKHRWTDKQTQKTDRQVDTHANSQRQTDRQKTDTHKHRPDDWHTNTDRQTNKQTGTCTHRQTDTDRSPLGPRINLPQQTANNYERVASSDFVYYFPCFSYFQPPPCWSASRGTNPREWNTLPTAYSTLQQGIEFADIEY